MKRGLQRRRTIILVIGFLILLFPFIDRNEYHVYIADRALINCMVASGLVALTGFAGQISFGHAAFYGIGAYTSALTVLRLGVPIWLGIILGAVLCCLIGMALSIPSFKVTGFFLSLVTISFGQIVWMTIVNWQSLTGGPYGLLNIPPVSIGGKPLSTIGYYYLMLAIMALLFVVSLRISRSFIGRAFMAMRDDELSASTMGINVRYYKLLAFSLSAIYGGIAGGLYAHLSTFLSPESFVFFESANFVAMAVVGGLRHVLGGIVGGVVVTFLPELLRFKSWETYYLMVSSFIIILIVIRMPSGIAPALENLYKRLVTTISRPSSEGITTNRLGR